MKSFAELLEEKLRQPFWRKGQKCYPSASTQAVYRRKLKPFVALHGHLPIADIPESAYADWFTELEKKYKQGHLAIIRSKMNAVLNYAVKVRALDRNPLESLRPYSQEPDQIVPADPRHVAAIIQACQDLSRSSNPLNRRDAAIMIFGIGGLRPSNIGAASLSLTMAAFANPLWDEDGQQAFYAVAVGGKQDMECVLLESDREIVESWLDCRPFTVHDSLFINMNADENTNHGRYLEPLTVEGLGNVRKRVCVFARVPLISFQRLRVRVGTRAAQISNSSERAGQVLGHSRSSGGRVVRGHYWDVDKHRSRKLAAQIRREVQSTPIEVPDLTEKFQQIEIQPNKRISA